MSSGLKPYEKIEAGEDQCTAKETPPSPAMSTFLSSPTAVFASPVH